MKLPCPLQSLAILCFLALGCVQGFFGCAPPSARSPSAPNKPYISHGTLPPFKKRPPLEIKKDKPIQVFQNLLVPEAEMHAYPNGTVDQIENGKVRARFRSPTLGESTLQYWRHYLKGVPYQFKENQLVAESAGLSVFFNPVTGMVQRVVEYDEN